MTMPTTTPVVSPGTITLSTVCAKPNSIGNRAASPIAISVPPASRNAPNASTPAWPIPPDISSVDP